MNQKNSSSFVAQQSLTKVAVEYKGKDNDSDDYMKKKTKSSMGKKSWWSTFNIFSLPGYNMPLTLEEQLDEEEFEKSYDQRVPFNLNRHLLLVTYFVMIVLTNRLFFGWPNLSNLLFKDGAYLWKCPKDESGNYIKTETDKRYTCKEQDIAVQNIFIVGSSAYYAFSFLNGIIVDQIGARLSMLLGHILNYTGWLLLLFSSENFDAYIIGGVLIAASIDLGSFATLNISGLYPSSENLVVNIISGAGSLSTGTMMLMDVIISQGSISFSTFMVWYLSAFIGFFFVLTIFIFPRTRFFRQYEVDNYFKCKENQKVSKGEKLESRSLTNTLNKTGSQGRLDEADIEVSGLRKLHDSLDIERGVVQKGDKLDTTNTSNNNSSESQMSESDTKVKNKWYQNTTIRDVFAICTCAHFICLWIYGPLNAIYNNFYYSVVEKILTTNMNNMLGILLPFSVIPCVLLGKITDKFGVMLMFYYELFFALSMYALSFAKNEICQWLSIISNTLYSACANGQLWTFISFTFSSKYHSTLIGILNLVCGLFSLLRICLNSWAQKNDYDFTYINILILGLIGVNIAVTAILVYIRKQKGNKVTIGDKMK